MKQNATLNAYQKPVFLKNEPKNLKLKFSVAQNIRTIRQLNKLSQKEFGEKLGFSARTISDWECSNTEPDITTLKSIKQIFNVSYEDILD